MAGQIIRRGERNFLVRVFLGRDGSGTRKYHNETVKGSKKDAEKVRTALLRKRDMGELVLEPTRMTVREYLEHWLETAARPRLTERAFEDYEGLIRRYVVPTLGAKRLVKLTPVEIQAVYGNMPKKGLSARTVRYCHMVLNNALNQAVRWQMTSQNPAQHVDLPKERKEEMQALSEEESCHFLEVAKGDKHYVLFAFLLGTGLRPGEAFALKWSDFDAAKGTITVQRTWASGKGGYKFMPPKTPQSRRTLDLPEGLTRLHLEHRMSVGESELIFPSEADTPLSGRNVAKRNFRPLLRKAGLPVTLRLYDLRHTHATLLLIAGVNPKIVSERLGHSSVTLTLDTYSHVLPGMQRDSAQKLDQMLFASRSHKDDKAYN